MTICYQCQKKISHKDWNYCPKCGRQLKITTDHKYLMTLHDAAQANRIEQMLKKISADLEGHREGI